MDDNRTIIDVLQDLPSVRPPIDVLLEFQPRLNCRYYSISSSSKVCV
jgi:NADPH-ferrihemoprotein reductase